MPNEASIPPSLARYADSGTISRGRAYFEEGLVVNLRASRTTVSAVVQGSYNYRTSLRLKGGVLQPGDCNCPVGDFCKHQVAVALAWQAQQSAGGPTDSPETDIRGYLESVTAYPETPARPASRWGRSRWDQTNEYGSSADDLALEWVEGLSVLWARLATYLMENAFDGVQQIEFALERIHSVAKEYVGPRQLLDRQYLKGIEMHLQACAVLDLPVGDLARVAQWLFSQHLAGNQWLCEALPRYLTTLGAVGRAPYEALVMRAWGLCIGGEPPAMLRHCLEALARARTPFSLEVLVCAMACDLSQPQRYLEISDECSKHGAEVLATFWVEEGMAQFPHKSEHLVNKALALYQSQGLALKQAELAWREFDGNPSAEAYFKLKQRLAGSSLSKAYCAQALRVLEQLSSTLLARKVTTGVRDDILAVSARDGDLDFVVRLCSNASIPPRLLPQIAGSLALVYPEEAAQLYLAAIHFQVGQDYGACERTLALVSALSDVRRQANQETELQEDLLALRSIYVRRRNLTAEISRIARQTLDSQ